MYVYIHIPCIFKYTYVLYVRVNFGQFDTHAWNHDPKQVQQKLFSCLRGDPEASSSGWLCA